jgi:hypothetical protein
LIEFLAAPGEYMQMKKAKRLIARQVARDRTDYEAILQDFFYLSSDANSAKRPNHGLRHNIIHCGKRLEDLSTRDERVAIFKRLTRYAGVVLEQLRDHGEEDWTAIEQLRAAAAVRLGVGAEEAEAI